MKTSKRKTNFKVDRRLQRPDSLNNVQKVVGNSILHGGPLAVGRRKAKRPLSKRLPIELVLMSARARGQFSLRKAKAQTDIKKILAKQSGKFRIRVESFRNEGTFLQIRLRTNRRKDFQDFLRSFSAMVARHITGARKGKPFGKFWDGLALTVILRPVRFGASKTRRILRSKGFYRLWLRQIIEQIIEAKLELLGSGP